MDTRKLRVWQLRKGTHFSFNVNGQEVVAWSNFLSWVERVYVNGELVSKQRSLLTGSPHTFQVGGVPCEVRFLGAFGDRVGCEIYQNRSLVQRKRLIIPALYNVEEMLPKGIILKNALLGTALVYAAVVLLAALALKVFEGITGFLVFPVAAILLAVPYLAFLLPSEYRIDDEENIESGPKDRNAA